MHFISSLVAGAAVAHLAAAFPPPAPAGFPNITFYGELTVPSHTTSSVSSSMPSFPTAPHHGKPQCGPFKIAEILDEVTAAHPDFTYDSLKEYIHTCPPGTNPCDDLCANYDEPSDKLVDVAEKFVEGRGLACKEWEAALWELAEIICKASSQYQ